MSGTTITTGYCICNDPIVNYMGDFFMKSLAEMGKSIEKVMCPTLMAFDLVVEVGSDAIPGVGEAITLGLSESYARTPRTFRATELLTIVETGVKTAKMFKHAYEAQDAAMEWASLVSNLCSYLLMLGLS